MGALRPRNFVSPGGPHPIRLLISFQPQPMAAFNCSTSVSRAWLISVISKSPFPALDAPTYVRHGPRDHRVQLREQIDRATAFLILAGTDGERRTAAVAEDVHAAFLHFSRHAFA